MPDTVPGTLSCSEFQQALGRSHATTAAELSHMQACDGCLESWLDATVIRTLNRKPEVEIPSGFASRIAKSLPAKRSSKTVSQSRPPHWGLTTAILLLAAGMIAMSVADPIHIHTWTGALFITLVVSEISGIALWLGQRRN
jgi:hypothetical protein